MATPLADLDGVYAPTAEMPLMKGFMADFTKAMDDHKSMFEISLMLNDAAKEAGAVSDQVHLTKTLTHFRLGYVDMMKLMHYVHPRTLRAIARGTLAYEHEQDPAFRDYQYDAKVVPGTYAVSLSIQGRGGRFLSQQELAILITHLEEYARAADVFYECKAWDPDDADHIIAKCFVDYVDEALGGFKDGAPKFAQVDGAVRNIRELAEMFRRRIDKTIVPSEGVSLDQVYQIQAPIMIGCTTETIAERTEHHVPQFQKNNPLVPLSSSLDSTTATWGLTLSVLEMMGLKTHIVRVAALGIFRADDLSLSEVLLTTIGQSLVWQTGFNIIQGVESKDKDKRYGFPEEREVCSRRDFLRVNLQATNNRMKQLRNNVAICKMLNDLKLDDIDSDIQKLEVELNELKEAIQARDEARAALVEKNKEIRNALEHGKAELEMWENLIEIQKFFAGLDLSGASGSG